jgi:NitT/TauT family transport system substrate-binding protein
LTICLTACTPPVESLTELKVCSTSSTTGVVVEYAHRSDLFAQYGLAVELEPISDGSSAVAALIAGDIDVCQVAGPAVVNAALAGEDLVVVAGIINQQVFSLLARPEIETAEDLRGKVAAIARPGGASDSALRSALEKLGLEPDVDVTLLNVGLSLERLAAMETGQVAATMVVVTYVAQALDLGYHVLVSASDLDTPYQHTVIAARRGFVQDNRQTVTRFLQAVADSTARTKQDRSLALPILAENMLLDPDQDAEHLDQSYDIVVQGLLSETLYPTPAGIQALIDAGRQNNPGALELSPENIIDASIVQELNDSGFVDKLYGE